MKQKLLLLLVVLSTFNSFSQTIYTFIGDGDWTDVTKWENGSYPGTTVKATDIVEILGKLTVLETTIITNNGNISTFSTATTTPEIKIIGGLVNNKNINFSRAKITIDIKGTLLTNTESNLVVTDNSILTNNGAILLFSGTISISSSVSSIINEVTGSVSNNGTLKVLNGTFENKSSINNAVWNGNTFEVTNGKVINSGFFNNHGSGTLLISNTFTNNLSGELHNQGQITIKNFSSSIINYGNFINSKNLNLEDSSAINFTTGSTFTNSGSGIVVISADSKIVNSATDFVLSEGKITNDGTITNNTSISIGGSANLENNGTLNNNFGASISNHGTVSGINSVHNGTFSNEGILSPGNTTDATALYKLDSYYTSYTQTAAGSLNIDLSGTIAGDSYDQVVVDRDVTINGTLNVSLLGGFEPAIGDVFTILRQGRNVSGSFSTVNLPKLSGKKVWDVVEYSSTDGIRITVKESTLGLADFSKETVKINVFPNPTSDKIFVSGVSYSSKVSVFDLKGRKVLESVVSNENSSIDLYTLNSGVYVLKVQGQTFKFVKK